MDLECLEKPWHIAYFNGGVEIRYVSDNDISCCIPLELGDDGHTVSLEFAKYLVSLHNGSLNG